MVLARTGATRILLTCFILPLILATLASAQRITATWQGQRLALVLDRVAEVAGRTIWLDRRVDPRREVNARIADRSVDDALADLAANLDLGVAQLGGVTYIGPQQTANGISVLSEHARETVRRTPSGRQRLLLKAAAWQWPRLSEPRSLVAELARQANLRLEGADLVPHDLWQGYKLPPLALVDRMVLVLAGFDLTCEFTPDGKTCRIVPIDYPLPDAHAQKPQSRAALPRPRGEANTQRRFTLRLENKPVGRVVDQLAQQLNLEITWDESSLNAKRLSRDALVSCDLHEADLDGLLVGILEPVGMTYVRDGGRVRISAAP